MLIDIYIAALEKSQNKDEWNAFSRYLKSYPAQKILAENGYRPVNKQAIAEFRSKFPVRPGETKITDKLIGGWRAVDKKWFDPNEERHAADREVARSAHWLAPSPRRRASRRRPRTAGREPRRPSPCGGFVTTFLLVIVVLPIAAIVWTSTSNGGRGFWDVVSSPQAVAALKLSLVVSTLAVLTTAVFGTMIAWMLVRDDFRGKSVVNAIIDLPFALPTIVVGLVIIALYGPQTPLDFTIGSFHFDANVTFTRWAIYVALLFVTLPFVVRTVQPVLIELDEEMEDASNSLGASNFQTFRRIVLPNILPGILSGVAMAFARAVGEIGAIVLIAGNLPFKTEVASIHLFQRIDRTRRARRRSPSCCSLISFAVLLGIGGVRGYVTRHERG